jgi:hypothetical protein
MDSGDWSWQKAALQDRIHDVANNWILPSVLYRPDVFQDGDHWCCLYGNDLMHGVVAFGKTPAEAVSNFDYYAWHGKSVPEKKP